ncbi:MAG: hypothetical protein ACLVKR_08225, partial [Lachnospiraceae bacterium]
ISTGDEGFTGDTDSLAKQYTPLPPNKKDDKFFSATHSDTVVKDTTITQYGTRKTNFKSGYKETWKYSQTGNDNTNVNFYTKSVNMNPAKFKLGISTNCDKVDYGIFAIYDRKIDISAGMSEIGMRMRGKFMLDDGEYIEVGSYININITENIATIGAEIVQPSEIENVEMTYYREVNVGINEALMFAYAWSDINSLIKEIGSGGTSGWHTQPAY